MKNQKIRIGIIYCIILLFIGTSMVPSLVGYDEVIDNNLMMSSNSFSSSGFVEFNKSDIYEKLFYENTSFFNRSDGVFDDYDDKDVVVFDDEFFLEDGYRNTNDLWDLQTVDSNSSDHSSIAVDDNNNPHISYYDTMNKDLKYAFWNGSGWSVSVVDSAGDVGRYSSIALDSNGYPHISYYDSTEKNLKYAYWNGASWLISTVDSSTSVGSGCSIAIDSNDRPHISYIDNYYNRIKYAHWTGGSWQIRIVESGTNVFGHTSIDVDSNNRPHIAYQMAFYLKYSYWTGSAWAIEQVEQTYNSEQIDLFLDLNNTPHLSYHVSNMITGYYLKYATKVGSSWAIKSIQPVSSEYVFNSITVDINNKPIIAYYYAASGLKYAVWMGYNWNIHTVDATASSGSVSISIDSDNKPHICYRSDGLKYAYKSSDEFPPNIPYDPVPAHGETKVIINPILSWIGGDPDSEDMVTYDIYFGTNSTPSLVETIGPFPWNQSVISWAPGILKNYQRYLWRIVARDSKGYTATGPLWNFFTELDQQNWAFQIVDANFPNDYFYSCLALDNSNNPHVTYLVYGDDVFSHNLKYARYTGNSWIAEYVEYGPESSGRYGLSIDIDNSNNPHLSYVHDWNLKHTYKVNNVWNYEIVEKGCWPSIAIDSSNKIHISYGYQHYNDDIKYAYWNGYYWDIQTINSSLQSWTSSAMAIDSDDHPHIIYLGDNGIINYAKWTGSYWNKQTIDSDGTGLESSISIVIDSNDYPHVAYHFNDELRYAYWNGYSWVINLVDSRRPGTPSIDLDSNNRPHISYINLYSYDFYYAYWNGIQWIINPVEGFEVSSGMTSMKLDDNDIPHVSYFDSTTDILKYATKTGPGSPPNTPREITPNFKATNINIDTNLHWKGGDPDLDDTVTYKIYFGDNPQPPLVGTIGPTPATIKDFTWELNYLEYLTTYYWQIIAEDNHGNIMQSPMYEFTTQELIYPTALAGGPYYCNPGLYVQFNGGNSYIQGGGNIVQYDWKFYENDIWHNDLGAYPTYTYTEEGIYNASLRVWSIQGLNNTDNATVYINYNPHPPTASLRAGQPYQGMELDEPILFNASYSRDNNINGTLIQYDWDWTNNGIYDHTTTTPYASHIYQQPGTYTIKLRVHNNRSLTSNTYSTVTIYPYLPPVAKAGGPYIGMQDTQILFDASGSYDPDQYHINNSGYYIDSYRWDFNNNGIWDTDWIDFNTPIYPYTYGIEYYGLAKLQVKDNEGETGTATAVVEVEGYKDPVAVISGSTYGIVNVPFQFDGSYSHDQDQNGCCITSYKWQYYEGGSWHDDGPTPTHTYTSTGTYTVTLNITDNDPYPYTGYDEISTTVTIQTYQNPTASAGGPYFGETYIPIIFDASGSYDNDQGGCCIIAYRWDFNNNGIWDTPWLTSPFTSHTYTQSYQGLVRVQVKDNDPYPHTGYDIGYASITVESKPPTADFTIIQNNNPLIFTFDGSTSIDPRPGKNYKDLYYRWDFNNNGVWDLQGSWSTAGNPTYSYSTSGHKTIKLEVSNIDGSTSITKTVFAYNYGDINVHVSNPNFFFSWPGTNLPKLKNRYSFTTPSGVFDKVTFEIAGNIVTDNNGPHWQGILDISDAQPGNKVIIKGYVSNNVIWTKIIDINIIHTPTWFKTFVATSNPSISHHSNYAWWKLTINPITAPVIGSITPNINVPFAGGKYGFEANAQLPSQMIIDSSESFVVVKRLAEAGAQVNMSLPKAGPFGASVYGGFNTWADIKIDSNQLYMMGYLNLNVGAQITTDIPIIHIGVAEVGASLTIGGEIGTTFPIAHLGTDGISFLPSNSGEFYMKVIFSGGLYAQIISGLGRIEGGLNGEGGFRIYHPSFNRQLFLNLGLYAKATALWGWWTVWEGEFTLIDQTWNLGRDSFETSTLTEKRRIETVNSDLLCLRDNIQNRRITRNDVTLLTENVGKNANPKIVLLENGYGLAVWSDISSSHDGFQSDLYWSVYDNGVWGPVENTATLMSCEMDPELIVVDDDGTQKVVLTYLMVDKIINDSVDVAEFYAGARVHTAVWDSENGWSFSGGNFILNEGLVKTRSMNVDDHGSLYMSFLMDSDLHTWEQGIGRILVVKGEIAKESTGNRVIWNNPIQVSIFDSYDVNLKPQVSFVDTMVGGVVYQQHNYLSGENETLLIPTVSGIEGFTSPLLLDSSEQGISFVSSVVVDEDIMVFWVENYSVIRRCIVSTNQELDEWNVGMVESIYSMPALISIKPVFYENNNFLLLQEGHDFNMFIIEERDDGNWGNLRRVSVNDRFVHGQIDGDSNNDESHMIYVRESPVIDWLIGRWRFTYGQGDIAYDSSPKGNDGLVINATWVDWFNNSLGPHYGSYIRFNGSESLIEIPYNNSLILKDEFSLTCWVNLSQTQGIQSLIGVDGSWKLFINNGMLGVKLWRSDGVVIQSDISTIPIHSWTFLGLTYQRGILRVNVRPVNGELTSAMFDLGWFEIVDSGNPLILGGFSGDMDEVWLFNRDISMSEIDGIWFSPYPTLGGVYDIMVQRMPSYAEISFMVRGQRTLTATTEDIVEFVGSPQGFIFEWDFGDGFHSNGQVVSHQYTTAGIYTVICNVTDPLTGVVTPVVQSIDVIDTTPPVFSGLSSVLPGDRNVTLEWEFAIDNSGFVMYQGFIRNETGVFNFSNPVFTTLNTSYVISDLEPGVLYHFMVRAFDASGNHDTNTVSISAIADATTPPLFDGISGLYEVLNQRGSVLLEWPKALVPSGQIQYNVYVASKSGGHDFSSPNITTDLTWVNVGDLELWNKTYYVVVRAIDAFGNEDQNMVEFSTSPISWDASLFFSEPGGANDFLVLGESAHALNQLDSFDLAKPPMGDTPCLYSVFTSGFVSPFNNLSRDIRFYPSDSQWWNISLWWNPAFGMSSTEVTISWNVDEFNDSGYEYIGLVDHQNGVLVSMLHDNSYTFNASAGVALSFSVFCGEEELNLPPFKPSQPTPNDGMIGVDVSTLLSWTGGDPNSGDIVTYDVYFGTTNDPPLIMNNHSQITFNPGYMEFETMYYWRIVSWDNQGLSATGPLWSFKTMPLNLAPVFGLPSPLNGSMDQPLNLVWSIPISDPEGDSFDWTIECNNGQSTSGIGEINGTKTLNLLNLEYSTMYIIWVNATDSIGSGLYTRAWYTFTTEELIEYILTISTDPDEGGFVDISTDPPYYYGTLVTLTAFENPGFSFSYWSGDASGNDPEVILNMTDHKSVTAHFQEDCYSLDIDVIGNGNVILDPEEDCYLYGITVEVTAIPEPGWIFSHWTGDLSGSVNPESLFMNNNKVVTAHFIEDIKIPNLSCIGSLNWADIKPGSTATGKFFVYNSGDPNSLLNWEILSYPNWGTWIFTPNVGVGLTPEEGLITINVEVIAPNNPEKEYTGSIIVVNNDTPSNFCTIPVILATPVWLKVQQMYLYQRLLQLNPRLASLLTQNIYNQN